MPGPSVAICNGAGALSPYWRVRIVRGVAAGIFGVGGLGIIGVALTQILVLDKAVPASWIWVLLLGIVLVAVGLGLTLPGNVWRFLRNRITHRWFYQAFAFYVRQRRAPNQYLHLYDVKVDFLTRRGGELYNEWRFEAVIASRLLRELRATQFEIEILGCADANRLIGAKLTFRKALYLKPLDHQHVEQRAGSLPEAAYDQLVRRVENRDHSVLEFEVQFTGYRGDKEIFAIHQMCSGIVRG